jgi:hypothetical protein
MSQKDFVVVARPGRIFNLTDCGIPLDITCHTPVDLLITAKPEEIEKSMQLREALLTGALIRIEAHKPAPKLPDPPAPTFVIPEMRVDPHRGHLSTSIKVEEVAHRNAPSSFNIEGDVSDEVRAVIEHGIVANKDTDIAEQQRLIANKLKEEEHETDLEIRTMKKDVPQMATGMVDGHPVGYDFKAPPSPALAQALQGMGDSLPPVVDPLGANTQVPKTKKGGKAAKSKK